MKHEVPMTSAQTALDLPAMVRSRDYRRFVAIQFAAPADRLLLYALTAFANEMRDIPRHVREPLAGFMRYAWWREALQDMEQGAPPRPHPLLQQLAPWLAANPQAYTTMQALIESGQRSIEGEQREAEAQAHEAALDTLWATALAQKPETVLKVLRSLPLGQHIGPIRLLQVMIKSLVS